MVHYCFHGHQKTKPALTALRNQKHKPETFYGCGELLCFYTLHCSTDLESQCLIQNLATMHKPCTHSTLHPPCAKTRHFQVFFKHFPTTSTPRLNLANNSRIDKRLPSFNKVSPIAMFFSVPDVDERPLLRSSCTRLALIKMFPPLEHGRTPRCLFTVRDRKSVV